MKTIPLSIVAAVALLDAASVFARTSVTPASHEVGPEPVSYQILVNANADWTATTDAAWMTLSPASGSQDNNIQVTAAANGQKIAAGNLRSLAVASGDIGPTSFSIQPTGQTVQDGGTVSFTAKSAGSPTYQWQVSTDSGRTWTNVLAGSPYSGPTTDTLTITGVTVAMTGNQYRCLASNSAQSDVASNAALPIVTVSAPTVSAAKRVTNDGFTASWSAVSGATGYRLDVATDSAFSSPVTAYWDMDVGGAMSKVVSGMLGNTAYYYRVRAYNDAGPGPNSSTVAVTTSVAIVVRPPLTVSTLAGQALSNGTSDGTGSAARFYYLTAITADNAGSLYVADTDNHTIRKIVASTGAVTTLAGQAGSSGSADGTGSAARFNAPSGVAVDSAGNVYVADTLNHTLRKVTSQGVVSTLAGSAGTGGSADGIGSAARFQGPQGLTIDANDILYVADTNNHTIRKAVPATGAVTTVAGLAGNSGSTDGLGSLARFNFPSGVAVDSAGKLYVADSDNDTIRAILPSGLVSTLAGFAGSPGSADGTGGAARFNSPSGVAVDLAGNLYVTDTDNDTIRSVIPSTGAVTTLAGLAGTSGSTDGLGSAIRFFAPAGIAVDSTSALYVSDTNNHTVRVGLMPVMPTIQIQPQTQWGIMQSMDTQFSVTAYGRPALSYQWYFNGKAISGATGSVYRLSNVQPSNEGDYTVVVSNIVGSVTSDPASLAGVWTPLALTHNSDGPDSGGGGAPSAWFFGALLLVAAVRMLPGRRASAMKG